ncbi:WD40 repeat domain-containing protein [Pyrobaculum neutrophilum]|uniref:Bacterial repeat domain-containing protein n=1 Tax=Pyrobaculum neutrophilum (strain DSM 2338 / JCM 9278 / NBRC 100436 / V24Sta) TaxID=444157 RepID=B1YA96_PYRNV|nr:hypothetical protein [Pyrobaculum neutrophilum]ACB39070.1 conserved hypothetical protein [Pyrobaculum neutrophilum V24Sta]
MRWLVPLLLAALAFAYVVPSEGLDVYWWAAPDKVAGVGIDGRTLWQIDAVSPLAATDQVGRCVAVVNRPYLYVVRQQPMELRVSIPATVQLSPDLVSTLSQYGISFPSTVNVVLNFTIPLPPLVLASVYKTSVASLHTPYGYPLWAVSLGPRVNATAVATNCRDVAVGTISGEVYVLRDGKVYAVYTYGEPVTALAYGRDVLYVGTAGGKIYAGGSLVGSCSGSVYYLAMRPDGSPVALCFSKGAVPTVEYYPYGVRLTPSSYVDYGIDTPKVPAALSQDGSLFVAATQGYVVAFSGGRELWRAKAPSLPTAVAASNNGSIVVVGTLGGDVLVYWNGREAARFLGSAPVTSVAVSADGRALAVERWNTVSGFRIAFAAVRVSAPPECLPAEVQVAVGGSVYRYLVSGSGVVLLPVGDVTVAPQYKYLGDFRCRPFGNVTLAVRGDLESPIEIGYVKEYRVHLSPPNITRGPAWAAGPATFFAEPSVNVPVYNSPVSSGRLVLVGWEVDGRRIDLPTPTLSVNVEGPTTVKAIYRVELPQAVPIDEQRRYWLKTVLVFDAFGNPVASGVAPEVSIYPVVVRGVYVEQYRVRTYYPATVNGSDTLWAEAGTKAVFYAPDVEFRNGTRLAFVRWREAESRERTLAVTVEGPTTLTPIYVTQYRVWVKPPAQVVEPPNATWADRGSVIRVAAPPVLNQSGDVRTVVGQWLVNGLPNATGAVASFRVTAPLNITYVAKRQYLVTFVSAYGTPPPPMWVDEGSTASAVPTPMDVWSPPPLHWKFVGWRDKATGTVYSYPQMPYVYGPATFEAVWALDPLPLAAIGGGAAAAAFAVWFLRRRRLARLMAEVAE